MAQDVDHRRRAPTSARSHLSFPFGSKRGSVLGILTFLAMAVSLSFAMGTAKPLSATAESPATDVQAEPAPASEPSVEPAPATEVAESEPTSEPVSSEAAVAPPPADEPQPVTEGDPVIEEPVLATEEPVLATEEPAPATDEPVVTNDTEPANTATAIAPDEQPATISVAKQLAKGVTSDTVGQCNNVGTVGGDTITCTVTITNDCTYNAATPKTPTCETTVVTEISCTGSAICPTGGTQILTEPITVVTQCNNAGTGGASTITCTITVTNNLYGYPVGSRIDSTVVQCQDPGAVDTLTCVATPPGNNRLGDGGPGGQSVRQCNRSGGQAGTMTCTVTAPPSQSTGLPITIRQCIESGTTGASTVTCTATITNNFIDSIPGGDGPGGDGPGGDGPGGDGPGGDGPGGDGPGGDGPGGEGPGGEGPGGDGPGGDGPGGSFPPTAGGENPPGGSVPPGGGGDNPPGPSAKTPPAGQLPFTGFDIGIAAMFSALTILLGLGLRRIAANGKA